MGGFLKVTAPVLLLMLNSAASVPAREKVSVVPASGSVAVAV